MLEEKRKHLEGKVAELEPRKKGFFERALVRFNAGKTTETGIVLR